MSVFVMSDPLQVHPQWIPELDPEFVAGALWNREFRAAARATGRAEPLAIALERPDGSVSVYATIVFPHAGEFVAFNERYVERLVKFLLWQRGGCKVIVAGDAAIGAHIRGVYSPAGARAFDHEFMGERIYGQPLVVESRAYEQRPEARESGLPLGRHLDGCRIGFDLGGSDRKCAAVIDGEVVFSEETAWDPYFQSDPQYHYDGIMETLRRAAEKLPRVDAIGGSAAGVYVNNEIRVASLFRGVPRELFDTRVRRLFFELRRDWGGIPFVVVNDGEVTALAGSMALDDSAVLGVSMGTSQAGGYVNAHGNITGWLNELAFAPVDYRLAGPMDEWSRDHGVGAQYFSQQAVNRLLPAAGIDLPPELPLAEKLVHTQELMARGDARARRIYATLGVYFGYAIAQYADFYELKHLLVLGRVLSGEGGDLILARAGQVLKDEFPEVAERVALHVPGEKEKRHGQAVAAASLPSVSLV
jgi:predicted NBD/HSP70 family sugar kinase